jgi:hypothetical protein
MVLAFSAFGSISTDNRAAEVLKQTSARQEQALRQQLKKTFPPKGMWHHENFAIAAYWLNTDTAKADDGILLLQKQIYPTIPVDAFNWHAYVQERLYFLFSSRSKHFPGRMGAKAENAVLEMLWNWAAPVCRKELALTNSGHLNWGSENHHIMFWTSFWGAAHIFKDHPDYKNRTYTDGSTPAEMAIAFDEYFKAYARERATKGLLWEVASPTYSKYTLNAWYNLADFAENPILKERMSMLLDLYWTDWAIEQIEGVRGGSRHRCYPGRASTEQSGGAEAAWYHFGLGVETSSHPGVMCAATTFWRPSPLVVELAIDTNGRGEYSYISRRPGLKESDRIENFVKDSSHPLYKKGGVNCFAPEGGALVRTSWCTPDFVAGMSQVKPLMLDDWIPGSCQNRWNGIIFAGHPTARIFTQPLMPKKGSVYNAEWGVQNKGVMILQRLRQSNAKGQMIWFDNSLKRIEKEDWIFIEAPQAYAAVRVVKGGGKWQEDSISQRRDGRGRDGLGRWFALNDEYSPVIMEVARKKDYTNFESFQKEIRLNPFSWERKYIKYRSKFYHTTLTLPVDAAEYPLIDDQVVNFEPKEVYKSPYLNGYFGKGVVEIQKDGKTLILDFEKDDHIAQERGSKHE